MVGMLAGKRGQRFSIERHGPKTGKHWVPALLCAIGVLACVAAVTPVRAADPAFNPNPGNGDVIVPMPGTMKMVLVRVPVPGAGVLGGGERIFEIGGDKSATQPFEYPRLARIGSSFISAKGDSSLVFGKYEVTIGQYAAVLGDGDLAKGIEHLRQISHIEQIPSSAPENDMRFLARPVHGISYEDHIQFIANYNAWCLKTAACISALTSQLGGVGTFRLPVEYEWEFVARGGSHAALPFDISAVGEYALINSPRRTFPDMIGQKKPLPSLPIYDIFGNVAELMGVPFTMDNGAGAVGGWVARGGDYKTSPQSLRASMREEVRPFFKSKGDGGADVYQRTRPREAGIRLMLGAPIRDPDNKGIDDQIAREFQSYVSLGDGKGGSGDIAGNTRADAKSLGTIDPKKPFATLSDTVGGNGDPSDWFTFIVPQYGTLNIELASLAGDVALEYRHAAGEESRSLQAAGGKKSTLPVEGVLPGQVYLRVYSARGGEARYALNIGFDVKDRAGNTPHEAADLGQIDGRNIEITDYVGPGDKFDVYKFTTGRTDTISVRLLDLTADVNMELLGANEQVLASSTNPRTLPEQIDHRNAPAGTYYLRVYSKDDQPGTYRLLLSLGVLDTAGNSRDTARDLGTLTSDLVSIEENLGPNDRTDFFRVKTTGNSTLVVQVARHTANVDLYVYDEKGAEIGRSKRAGTEAEKVEVGVPQGTYYIEVRNDTNSSTPYFMTAEVRPVAAYGHADMAYKMGPVSVSPATFSTSLSDDARARFVEFNVTSATIAKITLETLRSTGANTDIDLYLYNSRGQLVAKSVLEGSATEEIVENLEPGAYIAKIWRDKGSTADVRLTAMVTTQAINPTVPGQLVATHGDWEVRTRVVDGKKDCIAYTIAKETTPGGWRARLPFLFILVNPGETGVSHSFDWASYYNAARGFTASIETRTNGAFNIPIRMTSPVPEKAQLRSLVQCGSNLCVANDALRGLTRGHTAVLRGYTKDNRETVIRYSLSGYQAAIRAMNDACNNASKTGWLIKD